MLSEKTKAKIKEIKRYVGINSYYLSRLYNFIYPAFRFRELVNNFDASDVQDELKVETCCFKHSDAVTDRYKFIRELGRVSLASTLRTSISCIDNLNCGILPVNKMIDVVEHYVTKSTIKEAFDREIFSSYISHNSRITNDELLVFNNSLGYDLLYQKVRGYTSNLNLHSIDRFISSTLKYIDENFPMFYITQNLDELMY